MFCTKCGKELNDNNMFCAECGEPTKLAGQVHRSQPGVATSLKKKPLVPIIILATIVTLGVLAGVMNFMLGKSIAVDYAGYKYKVTEETDLVEVAEKLGYSVSPENWEENGSKSELYHFSLQDSSTVNVKMETGYMDVGDWENEFGVKGKVVFFFPEISIYGEDGGDLNRGIIMPYSDDSAKQYIPQNETYIIHDEYGVVTDYEMRIPTVAFKAKVIEILIRIKAEVLNYDITTSFANEDFVLYDNDTEESVQYKRGNKASW